jgi:Fe-S oxidoreductase
MVDKWLNLASVAPALANVAAQAPGLNSLVKSALGIADKRSLPKLAPASFRKWASVRNVPTGGGDVILWVDTFNNSFHPETTQAALDVLIAAGCRVFIPQDRLCCGRPLYDFGFIDQAVEYLRRILTALADPIDRGIPIVVLEPSCASVFRDELRSLLPDDARAAKLRAQTFLLSEFLERKVPGYLPPQLSRRVMLHGHCHHKAVLKMGDEESLLKKMGTDLQTLDSGCCGMAGPFGMEASKYDVSMAIGERVLLPAVRQADTETIIVSDGFSCREQISQATGRHAIHLADLLKLGLSSLT